MFNKINEGPPVQSEFLNAKLGEQQKHGHRKIDSFNCLPKKKNLVFSEFSHLLVPDFFAKMKS